MLVVLHYCFCCWCSFCPLDCMCMSVGHVCTKLCLCFIHMCLLDRVCVSCIENNIHGRRYTECVIHKVRYYYVYSTVDSTLLISYYLLDFILDLIIYWILYWIIGGFYQKRVYFCQNWIKNPYWIFTGFCTG